MEDFNIINEDDLMSKLPSDLIYKIIKSLPYASASVMKQLCKKMRDFWDTILVQNGEIDDLSSKISSFLDHINDCDPLRYPWNLFYQFDANSFFLFAYVLGNYQLHLNFSKLMDKYVPIFHLSLKPNSQIDFPSPPPINLTFCVKTLNLKSINHLTSSIVASLVTNFNFLESLFIEECKGLHSLHISTIDLKELTILECFQLSTLHLNTPKLESFRYRGPRPWILVDGQDQYKLTDVMLDFRLGARSKYLGRSHLLLLSSLMNVTCATICAWNYQEIMICGLYLKLTQLKELCWIERVVDRQKIQMLLSFLNLCPNLQSLFIIGMAKDIDGAITKGAKLGNLKVIKIEGCKDESDETLLVESLLEAITVTEAPTIISNYNFDEVNIENTWFSQLKHPHFK